MKNKQALTLDDIILDDDFDFSKGVIGVDGNNRLQFFENFKKTTLGCYILGTEKERVYHRNYNKLDFRKENLYTVTMGVKEKLKIDDEDLHLLDNKYLGNYKDNRITAREPNTTNGVLLSTLIARKYFNEFKSTAIYFDGDIYNLKKENLFSDYRNEN